MKGIVVIGPRDWGNAHIECVEEKLSTSMQYKASNFTDAKNRLFSLATPFPLFVYSPKNYQNVPNGSQTVEFECRVVEYIASKKPIISPWPTIKGPAWYDKNTEFKYEFWFKVDRIKRCNFPVSDFVFHKADGSEVIYETVANFISPARGKIMFATHKLNYSW